MFPPLHGIKKKKKKKNLIDKDFVNTHCLFLVGLEKKKEKKKYKQLSKFEPLSCTP